MADGGHFENQYIAISQWTRRSSAITKRPRDAPCLSVVRFNSTKRQAQSSIISYTLVLDLPLRELNYFFFSSLRRIHWWVAFCAVNRLAQWLWYTTGGTVNSTTFSRHRPIAGYRPTIVLIATGRRRVHSMRRSKILGQNPDLCLPHVHSTPPLGWFTSKYCYNVWYGKIKTVWLPEGEKVLKMCLFVLTKCANVTDTRTDIRTDTAWRLRPRLHSIARQKWL